MRDIIKLQQWFYSIRQVNRRSRFYPAFSLLTFFLILVWCVYNLYSVLAVQIQTTILSHIVHDYDAEIAQSWVKSIY